jgi:hypothetical protein
MTQRHRWRRTPGNDGAVRVFVPDGPRRWKVVASSAFAAARAHAAI